MRGLVLLALVRANRKHPGLIRLLVFFERIPLTVCFGLYGNMLTKLRLI